MNRTQTGLSIAILATMMMPILSDIVFKWIIQVPFLDYVFLILSLLLFLISFLGYVVVNVHQDLRLLSHSERAVLGSVMGTFNVKLDLITHLVQTYELRHLGKRPTF